MKRLILLLTVAASLFVSASPSFAENLYTVKAGDTMSQIASEFHLTLQELLAANPQIENANLIHPGESIHINKENGQASSSKKVGVSKQSSSIISSADRDLLARLVHAEAGGEPFAGQVEVANVVLNRVDSNQFPNSIPEVINQPGQFQAVSDGAISQEPDSTNYKAVDEAINNRHNDGSLYYYNPALSTPANCDWFATLPTVTIIGHHIFKK
ncbi:cell wall hydrolase [Pullulanibacillus sp. KACC 23026]|uniref:cell wall hydrolase n=1 Tax=Pullulanibacillus sp. KACC 23026 TaxID=3028315 RepID=UPI0023B15043|nr:cell wall hydrolase [Pullulanibacillus sp. KACC 23026]WEG11039.1 cell wall hydrolase [Pullulanibacillus sp. KACC 23026]